MKERMADSGGNAGETSVEEEKWARFGRFVIEMARQLGGVEIDAELQLPLIEQHRWEDLAECPNWVLKRSKEVRRLLQSFFGNQFRASLFNEQLFRETLLLYGKDQVLAWEAMGLMVFYLPDLVMERSADYQGWKVRPNDFYWESLAAGKLLRYNEKGELVPDKEANKLPGAVLLVDTRCKPAFTGGSQMWEDDYLGDTIKGLRKQSKLRRYGFGSQDSRFGISADKEWEEVLKPAAYELLNLKAPSYVRLETAMEFNVLSHVLKDSSRARDGQADTSVWLEEYFEDSSERLNGGYSDWGGLADVDWYDSWPHWCHRSLRPLAVLDVG